MFFSYWDYDAGVFRVGGRQCGLQYGDPRQPWFCHKCTGTDTPASKQDIRQEVLARRYEEENTVDEGAITLGNWGRQESDRSEANLKQSVRRTWGIGTEVKVFSMLHQQWYDGIISKIAASGNSKDLEVVYDAGSEELRMKVLPWDDDAIQQRGYEMKDIPIPVRDGGLSRNESIAVGHKALSGLSSAALYWAHERDNGRDPYGGVGSMQVLEDAGAGYDYDEN